MYERILVPLDGSQLAELALQPALLIAGNVEGRITFLNVPVRQQVILPSSTGYGPPVYDQTHEQVIKREEEYLSTVRSEITDAGVEIDAKVIEGDVAGVIVDTARADDIDLIVMTTHGYSGFTRWMLGSVTERVLREAPCPVLVIRTEGKIKKSLITLDGSRLAEQALEPGIEISRLLGCETSILRVDQEEKLSSVEMGFLDVASSDLCQEVALENADRVSYYVDCVARKFETDVQPIKRVVKRGKPAENILMYIEKEKIDLVAIATHGYSGLRRWAYGSVTEKILRNADCAMLVVRPPKESLN
ncbi:MAG: universal stress protein [Candidatus Promineifilaceae bacterium]|jgi:nucleotide-binding universal stress UspA family protein